MSCLFQLIPGCIHPGCCIPFLSPTLLPFLHTSSQQLCLGCQHLRLASFLFHLTPVFVPAASAQQSCLCSFQDSVLLIYLPAGSWGVLPWTKNLSWARQLRSSESPERHLMIQYLIKDYVIPKPKREPHTSYLI